MSDVPGRRACVVGASGFVGSAVAQAMTHAGWDVRAVKAPRLPPSSLRLADPCVPAGSHLPVMEALADQFRGVDVVINAAGDPDASSGDESGLVAVNGELPVVILRSSRLAQVPRMVHVSSAVVQGDRDVLDSSNDLRPFSAYARSKAAGEHWLARDAGPGTHLVIYRPPSVHGPDRRITRAIKRLGEKRLLSVAGSGEGPTPQTLIENVASAITFLADPTRLPPAVIHHPWEGLTCAEFLKLVGGREPLHVPTSLARAGITTVRALEHVVPALAPNRRRVQMLWFGQDVAPSWLTAAGWTAPDGRAAWAILGRG